MRQGNLKMRLDPMTVLGMVILFMVVIMMHIAAVYDIRHQEEQEALPKLTPDEVAVKLIQESGKKDEPSFQRTTDDIPGMGTDKPAMVARYSGVSMTDEERRELAAVVYLEAGNQPADGQQAVAEVVLNRAISEDFPGTVHDVLHQGEGTSMPQFSTAGDIDSTEPPQTAYEAVDAALYGESSLPDEVVYFSSSGENDRVWGKIGDHVFCYGYEW